MPLFNYRAVDADGRPVSGRLDALNLVDLEMRLKRMELDLVDGVTRAEVVEHALDEIEPGAVGVRGQPGIDVIEDGLNKPDALSPIHDIYGRYAGKDFESLPAGLYIQNGKKYLKR